MIKTFTIQQDEFLEIRTDDRRIMSNDPIMILEFLYNRNESDLHVCWNVDEFLPPILRLLEPKQIEKLAKTHKCFIRPYTLFYLPGKLFSIKKQSKTELTQYYSLDQYFPDLDDEPDDIDIYAAQLAEALDIMNLKPAKLTSPIAIYFDCMLEYLNLSAWENVAPKDQLGGRTGLASWALECSGKLWIEAFRIGYFEQTYDYDIVSCFPTVAMSLPDTKYATWEKSKQYQPDAVYGFCKGYLHIDKHVTLHPFMHNRDNLNYTPVGVWETWLTKSEIDFVNKWHIGTFEMDDIIQDHFGWWGFYDENILQNPVCYPLRKPIQHLLDWKQHENSTVRNLAKRMSNGFYGKFGEYHFDKDEYGQRFNPVWYSYISTGGRLAVADWIYRNNIVNNVIHISVDGVLTDCEVVE